MNSNQKKKIIECEMCGTEVLRAPNAKYCFSCFYKKDREDARKGAAKYRARKAKEKCIIDGCDSSVQTRGLCTKHYNYAYYSGYDWETLEEAGMALPPDRGFKKRQWEKTLKEKGL